MTRAALHTQGAALKAPLPAPLPAPLLDRLLDAGLLVATGVRGVYGRGAQFERIVAAVDDFAGRAGAAEAPEVLRFPPVLPRSVVDRSGYVRSFPHLTGTVHSFSGDDRDYLALLAEVDAGAGWPRLFEATDVVLTPAACYPVYAHVAGTLPPGGRLFDVQSYCFRHEPSDDPARMQIFRMREFVRLGSPEDAHGFRDMWIERGLVLLRALGLDAQRVVACDPFFGRGGRVMAASQAEQALKWELVVPVNSVERPTAVMSCNYHQDHFGEAFGIATSDGAVAHTACVGFGLERITLALVRAHGVSLSDWPGDVRDTLQL